jgi:formate-dependent nitrite reductase cytochrome c552 subunit
MGLPIAWNRVHTLPDFVYFNHGIHVAKGVACSECHGRVDQMPLMYAQNTLQMEW